MKILVTGGAGFIGSHLVDRFIADGHDVTVLDDLSFGHQKNVNARAHFVNADIRSEKAAKLIKKEQFDTIYHAAAQKSVRISYDDPLTDADINVLGTITLLEAARAAGTENFVLLSTGGTIYGDAAVYPTPETEPPQPPSPYTASKIAGEVYLAYYARQYNMHTISLRLANVYGPRQDPAGEAGVVAIFATRLLEGQGIEIYGDGNTTRDYVHVLDVCHAASLLNTHMDEMHGGVYNVGTGIETPVHEIADLVQAALGMKGKAKNTAPVAGELRRSALDSALLSTTIGWKPHIALEDGIQATVEWFKKQ